MGFLVKWAGENRTENMDKGWGENLQPSKGEITRHHRYRGGVQSKYVNRASNNVNIQNVPRKGSAQNKWRVVYSWRERQHRQEKQSELEMIHNIHTPTNSGATKYRIVK